MMRKLLLSVALLPVVLLAAPKITSPRQFFGHNVGDDYYLSNYRQFSDYWKRLDTESDNFTVISIGKTEEGREQLAAIVTSSANMKRLEEFRLITKRLTLAKSITESQAKTFAKIGKSVVWIDGGLHATEVLGAQQLIETGYRLISQKDEETKRILNDVIVVLVHANPDGMELCSNWYMQEKDPTKRNLNIPRLYQKYIGHDNNRDFLGVTQSETKNICRLMYQTWFPQIVYNHHQTGPSGTVMFAPPFRDPFNHQIDAQVMSGVDMVGAAMMQRFLSRDMPGVTTKTGSSYSAWWNGGLRTAAYFHNMIGILTETIGNPTPSKIPFVANRMLPQGNLLEPIEPQDWNFRKSIEYSVQANYAILDYASRYRETLLMNAYRMGSRQIEKGKSDSWTDFPTRVAKAKSFNDLRIPALRNPRYYVIPANQPEIETARRFANSMMDSGIEVFESTKSFNIKGKTYPARSLVISCQQAFRPFILDQFEPQDHPNDIPAPGAAPIPPYDSAGYTLAIQMGFDFDRILDSEKVLDDLGEPFKLVTSRFAMPTEPTESVRKGELNYFSMKATNNYAAVWKLLKSGQPVRFGLDGNFIRGNYTADNCPKLKLPRIALWDTYGGSMDSGWTRWIFEQFGIPYKVLYPKQFESTDLSKEFDVILLPAGAVSEALRAPNDSVNERIPENFQFMAGSISNRTIPFLKSFVDSGGTVIGIGSSSWIGKHLGLPIESALMQDDKPLQRNAYFAPGSLMRISINNRNLVASGMADRSVVFFDNNPVFKSGALSVNPIGSFGTENPLVSGWLWGPQFLKNGVVMAEANLGRGKVYMFAPEITFRAQPWKNFKLLFNALLLSAADKK